MAFSSSNDKAVPAGTVTSRHRGAGAALGAADPAEGKEGAGFVRTDGAGAGRMLVVARAPERAGALEAAEPSPREDIAGALAAGFPGGALSGIPAFSAVAIGSFSPEFAVF